jgi:chemotaxis protein MotA
MFAIIGIIVVLGAVAGGYFMAHGQFGVLFQPSEMVIIFGAALGSMLIGNPLSTVIGVFKSLLGVLKGSPYTKPFYLDSLKAINDVFAYARKNGLAKLEADVDEPTKSQLFTQYKCLTANHHALFFFCDSLRTAISGGVSHFELDQVMEADMEITKHEANETVHALEKVADSLPGLGIVAAVLGVVITMGSLGGPPEEIGHHVAAALVGTFLGILMCYGIVAPLACNLQKINDAEAEYYNFLRVGVMSFVKGAAPILATEMARRTIPAHNRPTFKEMEAKCRGGGGGK